MRSDNSNTEHKICAFSDLFIDTETDDYLQNVRDRFFDIDEENINDCCPRRKQLYSSTNLF